MIIKLIFFRNEFGVFCYLTFFFIATDTIIRICGKANLQDVIQTTQ